MSNFGAMVQAELRKVLSRASGQAGLAVSAVVGVGAVIALREATDMTDAAVNGQMIAELVKPGVAKAMGWALIARNFFVLNLILLMVTAQLMAGEMADNTLRAALVRPVSRGAILGAKFSALGIYAALTLAITAAIAFAGGAALFGFEESLVQVTLGYGASLLSDMGLIALGLLLSVLMRSVVGVVVGTVLFLMADRALAGVVWVTSMAGLPQMAKIDPFLPGTALGAWKGFNGGWETMPFVGLALFLAACISLAWLRFERADVA